MSKSNHCFSSPCLRHAIAEAQYAKSLDGPPFWFAMALCRLDLIVEHYNDEDPGLKQEAIKLLKDKELFDR